MDSPENWRAEIKYLSVIAKLNTDPQVLAMIGTLISELRRRLRDSKNGIH